MTKRIGERLVEAGLVSSEAVEQAFQHQKITGARLGDCLVDLGLIPEAALLRVLAQDHQTRYVTADKLAKARIPSEVLDRVPVRMCEAQDFLPIAFDADRRSLTVVIAEPQKRELIDELALITSLDEIVAVVGMRSAIRAGIKRHYYGDPTAFAALERGPTSGGPRPSSLSGSGLQPGDLAGLSAPGVGGAAERSSGSGFRSHSSSRLNPTQLREALGAVRGTIGENDYLETLNILVGLLELPRRDFRGHSAQVARQASLIARRLGLAPREVSQVAVAGYLHDLGKRPDRHLTLPLIAAQAEARNEAKRFVRAPIRLFETVYLQSTVNAILAQLYEAWDGSGVPLGAKGEDITPGARILAVVDAFFDLTRNPFNHLGRILSKHEAISALRDKSAVLFDAAVVETLATLQSGELLRQRLLNDGRQVFVSDPDEANRTDLHECLERVGLVVQTVVKLDALVDAILANEADTLVVGLAFGVNDIVTLGQFLRARPESAAVPLLVLGDPTDPQTRDRLAQAGVTTFLPIPLDPESAAQTIAAKLRERIELGWPAHPVRGSFEELRLPEVARLLGGARKWGRLTVRSGTQEGNLVFEAGRAVFAAFGDRRGEAALELLVQMTQSEFQYDPEALLSEMPNLDRDLELLARQIQEP